MQKNPENARVKNKVDFSCFVCALSKAKGMIKIVEKQFAGSVRNSI